VNNIKDLLNNSSDRSKEEENESYCSLSE